MVIAKINNLVNSSVTKTIDVLDKSFYYNFAALKKQ